eukprot:1160443-Pelagomonas_calceolata.AAC.17
MESRAAHHGKDEKLFMSCIIPVLFVSHPSQHSDTHKPTPTNKLLWGLGRTRLAGYLEEESGARMCQSRGGEETVQAARGRRSCKKITSECSKGTQESLVNHKRMQQGDKKVANESQQEDTSESQVNAARGDLKEINAARGRKSCHARYAAYGASMYERSA